MGNFVEGPPNVVLAKSSLVSSLNNFWAFSSRLNWLKNTFNQLSLWRLSGASLPQDNKTCLQSFKIYQVNCQLVTTYTFTPSWQTQLVGVWSLFLPFLLVLFFLFLFPFFSFPFLRPLFLSLPLRHSKHRLNSFWPDYCKNFHCV